MVGSIKAVVITGLAIGAILAALILAGNSLAATTYCSNAGYWAAEKRANVYQNSAHDLYMAHEYLDAYSEMLDAKYEISGAPMPCHPATQNIRRLTLLTYATWATAYRESYLEHWGAATTAFNKVNRYLKQSSKAINRAPLAAF